MSYVYMCRYHKYCLGIYIKHAVVYKVVFECKYCKLTANLKASTHYIHYDQKGEMKIDHTLISTVAS